MKKILIILTLVAIVALVIFYFKSNTQSLGCPPGYLYEKKHRNCIIDKNYDAALENKIFSEDEINQVYPSDKLDKYGRILENIFVKANTNIFINGEPLLLNGPNTGGGYSSIYWPGSEQAKVLPIASRVRFTMAKFLASKDCPDGYLEDYLLKEKTLNKIDFKKKLSCAGEFTFSKPFFGKY